MEPFSINCTTCHAALKVRKPEAIGEIYACPKCSGMVLIQRPLPPSVASAETVETPIRPSNRNCLSSSDLAALASAASVASYDQVDSLLDEPSVASDQNAPANKNTTTQSVDASSVSTPGSPGMDATIEMPKNFSEAEGDLASVAPIGPNQDWASAATAKSRTAVFYVLSACLGVALATGAVYLASTKMSRTTVVAPPLVENTESKTDVAPANNEAAAEQVTKTEAPSKLAPSELAEAELLPETGSATSSGVASRNKEKLDLVEQIPESPIAAVSFEEDKRAATSTPIDNFGDVGAEFVQPVATQSSRPNLSRLPSLPESSHEMPERRPLPEIDADIRLNDTFSATNLTLGLESMLNFISNASTVPVTIRPQALARSRYGFDYRVRVIGEDISHAAALQQALKQVKLGYRTDAGHIIVDRAAAISKKQVEYSHFVGDLFQVGWTGESLSKLVQSVVMPKAWQASGGLCTIKPTNTALETYGTEEAHFGVMYLCERLRKDHGLAPQRKASANESGLWRERRNLSQKIPPKRRRAGTLKEMISEFDRIAGKSIRILPDWHALAKVGWGPDSPAPKTIQQAELDVALREWLAPLQLTYRYAGRGYLEITTVAAEEQRFEIGFHPVKDLVQSPEQAAQLIEQLKSAIGANRFQGSGGESAMHYDGLGGNLIVRLPQSQQLDVDWLLGSLRQ